MRDRLSLAVIIATALISTLAQAAPVVIRQHESLAISPDGMRVADVESSDPGDPAKTPHGEVVVRAADGSLSERFDPCGACSYADTAWSPRGDALAFIASDHAAGKASLYVANHGGAREIAHFDGVANTVRWSPDGGRIALLVTLGAHKRTGAVEAGAAQVGEIGQSEDEQRIAILPAGGGTPVPVSPADTYVYEFDWTPDGNGFVATAAKGNGDNNWWVASLDHVDASTGALRVIAAPTMQMDLPRVSPDGSTVAFVGGLMSDWGSIGGDVYTVPVAGGTPVDITPGFKGSFRGIAWRGGKLLASALADDRHAVVAIDPRASTTEVLWSAAVGAHAQDFDGTVAFSADGGTAASVIEDWTHAPELAVGPIDRLAAVTRDNTGLGTGIAAQSVHWSNEGFAVQGWLLGPPKETGGRHPMVVIVHGGPGSQVTPRYVAGGQHGTGFDFVQDLVTRGYYVFYPNPRGSYGEGEAFTRANIRDFGGGDLRDILAGVGAVEKVAPVDDARLGLYGHSYGGWMSMWANTQTHRFKAMVAGAGIANWTSYYGQNGIDEWMIPFFGASVYDDPAVYRAASPIDFIRQAKTPTLIYVGERDIECPAPQSLEYWHGLKAMGTPTTLVIYPGEGHRFRKPEHLADLHARVIGWFDRYLGQTP